MDSDRGATAVFVKLADRPIPRVVRMMAVARELGFEPLFLGVRRQRGLPSTAVWEGYPVERIGLVIRRFHGRNFVRYVWSIAVHSLVLAKRVWELKPKLVHVSDFELYWPSRICAAFRRAAFIYNIHDNLAQRYPCRDSVARLLNTLEGVAVRCAPVTVVPERFRREALPRWAQSRVLVVRNTPMAAQYVPPDGAAGMVTVLYAGWIDAGRGIRELAQMVSRSPHVRLRVAGSGDDDLLGELADRERIELLGQLTHVEALRETAACDFVAALYDPDRVINRFAASNKIAEALAIGRPILMNAEIEVSRMLEEYQCIVRIRYEDAAQAGERLGRVRFAEQEYEGMCRRARQAYEDHYAWREVRSAILDAFEVVRGRAAGTVSDPGSRERGESACAKGGQSARDG